MMDELSNLAPASPDYDAGYKDALESMHLALSGLGVSIDLIQSAKNLAWGAHADQFCSAGTNSLIIEWRIEDVLALRTDLTAEQARNVLARVEHDYDSEIGVTWDTLEIAVNDMYPAV